MKKNRIVGDVEEQGELICELPGCGEYGFAETENTCEEALDHANSNSEVSHACHGLKSKNAFQGMVRHSSALLHVLELALRAAQTNCTILVQGGTGTGTGKELLARGIHANSKSYRRMEIDDQCCRLWFWLLRDERTFVIFVTYNTGGGHIAVDLIAQHSFLGKAKRKLPWFTKDISCSSWC